MTAPSSDSELDSILEAVWAGGEKYAGILHRDGTNIMDVSEAKAALLAWNEQQNRAYLASVMRARAKSSPDMTIKEFYDGAFKQRVNLHGAELTTRAESQGAE